MNSPPRSPRPPALARKLSAVFVAAILLFVVANIAVIETCRDAWTSLPEADGACRRAQLFQPLNAWLPIVERSAEHFAAVGDDAARGLVLSAYSFSWGMFLLVLPVGVAMLSAVQWRATERQIGALAEWRMVLREKPAQDRAMRRSRPARLFCELLAVMLGVIVAFAAVWGPLGFESDPSSAPPRRGLRLSHEYDLVFFLSVMLVVGLLGAELLFRKAPIGSEKLS